MSWNLGVNDVSEREQAFKDKLASKDGHIAALQTKLMKQTEEMRELQDAYNDKLRRLADETNRALQLEADLNARSDSLRNEKVGAQNVNQALVTARQTIKQKDVDVKELEASLESLSNLSDAHKSRADKLEQEKATLEARIRELQVTLPHYYATPTTPGHRRADTRSRSRSSSPSRAKIMALEQELAQLRSALSQKDADVALANEKVSHTQEELIRVGNEKTALERRMTRQLAEVQASLQDKEEELRDMQGMIGNESRERELEQRIEEDEAKILALEQSFRADETKLRKEMKDLAVKLKEESRRVAEAEDMHIELIREKEEVLDEFENARLQISSLTETLRLKEAQIHDRDNSEVATGLRPNEDYMEIDDKAAGDVQRLLTAVGRLRAERDNLRTSFDFLQNESKFEIEALNAKLAAASDVIVVDKHSAETIDQLRTELAALSLRLTAMAAHEAVAILAKETEMRNLGLAVTASAVVIQHLQSESDTRERLSIDSNSEHTKLERQLVVTRQNLAEVEDKLKDLELKLDVTVLCLQTTTSQRDDLLSQLEGKDSELEQAVADAKTAQESQEYFKQQLDNVESERNSLTLQLTHLDNELEAARDDIKAAESRYSELQFHQLDTMSKTEATRMLQNELAEERARVRRRDEHIAMVQHDIQRLETNLRLQEERLGEMTVEMEIMGAAKEAMVDDCADAREARDGALAKLESLEMEMETQLEEGDRAIETLVDVVMKTVGGAKDCVRIEREGARLANEALGRLEMEHKKLLRIVEAKEALLNSGEKNSEEVRQSTVALAISQIELGKALAYIRKILKEKGILECEIRTQQDNLDRESADRDALANQLDTLQLRASTAALEFANRTTELEKQIQDLQHTTSVSEATHRAAIEELICSKEHLISTLDQMQRSLVESTSNDDLLRLREQHTMELDEARARLSDSQRTLEELRSSHAATKEELETSLADVLKAKQELREQLAENSERLRLSVLQQEDAERGREKSSEDIARLQNDLDVALSQQQEMEAARDELQASFNRISEELATVKEQQEGHLVGATEQYAAIQQQLEGEIAELQTRLDDKSRELKSAVQQSDHLTHRLEEEVSSRAADKANFEKELGLVDLQRKDAESALAHLRQEVEVVQTQLEQSNQDVETLQQERSSLQEEITTLEAEIQRSISLRRFLESQVKESEAKVVSSIEELEQTRADLARSEKTAKAAKMNLSLQGAQHKREMSDLNRQLTALQTQPNLKNILVELEERNNEMEELLRNKCTEIEENDDRALEMLKENKKLATKVESLTRKVQNLQTKLATAKASTQAPSTMSDPPAPLLPSSSAPSNSGHKPSTGRARSITLTNSPPLTIAAPVPPIPALIPAASIHVSSPASRTPRAVSGPSSLPRPKTPERRAIQPPPVFKARTPERRIASSPPEASSSTTMVGKKRRAPDDFEACESLPPQGFTVDSLPSRERREDTDTTPRVRRVLSSFQSGFTPVRNQARPMMSMPSPKRLMMGTTARASPVIADVTNSPRGQSAKAKRSWLGKIRGASSQASSRPMDGRPRFERETS
ncbi:hypothetical protein D9615_001226 [Tricholomella constricta]|uniref:Uncharacterized protein n=1 Tax=Tricholomella constricta TaxID=117010 RepID=A0A8H5M984_9AGAR|nr:hypothetical protein D9615_001226 [Tricholomella constricta]